MTTKPNINKIKVIRSGTKIKSPITGRYIAVDGDVYNGILGMYEIKKESEIEYWVRKDPIEKIETIINTKSGRKVAKDGPTAKKLLKEKPILDPNIKTVLNPQGTKPLVVGQRKYNEYIRDGYIEIDGRLVLSKPAKIIYISLPLQDKNIIRITNQIIIVGMIKKDSNIKEILDCRNILKKISKTNIIIYVGENKSDLETLVLQDYNIKYMVDSIEVRGIILFKGKLDKKDDKKKYVDINDIKVDYEKIVEKNI